MQAEKLTPRPPSYPLVFVDCECPWKVGSQLLLEVCCQPCAKTRTLFFEIEILRVKIRSTQREVEVCLTSKVRAQAAHVGAQIFGLILIYLCTFLYTN